MKLRLEAAGVFAIVVLDFGNGVRAVALASDSGSSHVPRRTGRLDAPTPRTPDGKPDLSGLWQTVRTGTGQVIVGTDVPPLHRTSQFWNIGAGLDGDLPLRPWAVELRNKRIADYSKDNPDAHCLPIGLTQLHNHPQPRKMIQTPSLLLILYEANGGIRQIFTDGRPLPATTRSRGGTATRLASGRATRSSSRRPASGTADGSMSTARRSPSRGR